MSAAAETNLWPLAAVLPRVVAADEDGDDDDRAAEAEALGQEWQELLDDTVIEWTQQVSPELFAAAIELIEAAVRAGDVEALAALTLPVLGTELLLESMRTMFAAGAAFVVQEAADQGVTIKPAKPAALVHPWMVVRAASAGEVIAQTLSQWALAIVMRIGQRTSSGLAGEAMRLYRPGASVMQVTDGVQEYWDGLTDAVPREHIGAGLSRSTNLGKLETYAAAKPRGWRLELRADERLDRNTCKPCKEIDGTVLPTADAAALAYGGAGYLFCKGRERCRGTCRGIWTNRAPKNELDTAGLQVMLSSMRGLR